MKIALSLTQKTGKISNHMNIRQSQYAIIMQFERHEVVHMWYNVSNNADEARSILLQANYILISNMRLLSEGSKRILIYYTNCHVANIFAIYVANFAA